MKRTSQICCTLALLLLSLSAVPAANAALKTRSAVIDPVTGYPTWYQDNNNLALTNCVDRSGFCLAPLPAGFPPLNKAAISAANMPVESFYYAANTAGASLGGTINVVVYGAELEGGFATAAPLDGQQAVFSRVRYRIDVTIPGTYRVTHPYGVETHVIAAAGGRAINFTFDAPGLVAGAFDTAVTVLPLPDSPVVGPTLLTRLDGTFITDPATGSRYLGNAVTETAVVGSPFGTNFLLVEEITGANLDTFRSDTFSLQGKIIGMDVNPVPKVELGGTNIITPAAVPKTVKVTNTTGTPITFGAIAPVPTVGTDFADFVVAPPTQPAPPAAAIADCAAAPLAPAATCGFDVTFTPAPIAKAARTATIVLANTPPAPATDPPPVTLTLAGTGLVNVAATVVGHGTITPATEAVGAGTDVTFTAAPSSAKFKVKELAEGAAIVAPVAANPNTFTINAGALNHALTATFMPSGDLDANGKLETADALKALKIVAGLQAADADDPDNSAVDAAPLDASNKPAPNGQIGIGDVLVILRRVVGIGNQW
jgi:hypothetical protein